MRYNAGVKSIDRTPDGKRATGVTLESGEKIEADLVVCNADLLWAYENLLPETKYSKKLLKNSKLTCSSISFYWGIKRKVPGLKTHNVFLAKHYKESFDSIFDDHSMPDEPSFCESLFCCRFSSSKHRSVWSQVLLLRRLYERGRSGLTRAYLCLISVAHSPDINVPSRVDPSAAPEGKDAVVILVPVGHLLESKGRKAGLNLEGGDGGAVTQDWDLLISKARQEVIEKLTERFGDELELGPGQTFGDLIETELINTPQTWRDNFNLYKGSILGLSHNIMQVLCLRPRLIHDTIKVSLGCGHPWPGHGRGPLMHT